LVVLFTSLYSPTLFCEVPTEFGRLTKISEMFKLDRMQLSGTMPTELGNLVALQSYFTAVTNMFTGKSPTELGRLVDMENNFRLAGCSLTGGIVTGTCMYVRVVSVWG
jgi:hypothetical protein